MNPIDLTDADRAMLGPHRIVVLAKDQPQYIPLPCAILPGVERPCVTRWTFTPEERAAIAGGQDLFLEVWLFEDRAGHENPFPPARMTVGAPVVHVVPSKCSDNSHVPTTDGWCQCGFMMSTPSGVVVAKPHPYRHPYDQTMKCLTCGRTNPNATIHTSWKPGDL